ncbi:MAG TPA: hypothetical protein QF571_10560 [Desulfobacterales bacterium]|jgi:phospholipase/carboxylesterase|nr:hypothetical protein [Desulfobacterales bacterium]
MLDYVEINPAVQPSATVIWLHGLGADGHDFEPIVPELHLPETLPIRFIFPHAPKRPITINAGMILHAWYDAVDLEGERKIDLNGFMQSVAQVNALIRDEMLSGLSSERLILAGFSQGGAIALYTGLTFEMKLGGIMALSCYLPVADQLAKKRNGINRDIPIMMGHGTMDPMIPMTKAVQTRQDLTSLGYRVSWYEYAMVHTVCPEEINDVRDWLLRVLVSV